MEQKLAGIRGGRKWSYCLVVTEFLLGVMKIFGNREQWWLCNTMTLNATEFHTEWLKYNFYIYFTTKKFFKGHRDNFVSELLL